MFDTLTFDTGFDAPTDLPVDPTNRTWQSKGICGVPNNRQFQITADGVLEQRDDEGWIRRLNTETGRFYRSITFDDGTRKYYSFNISFEGGVVTGIELDVEKLLD